MLNQTVQYLDKQNHFIIYNETILDAMERYTITKSTNRPLYGIVDDRGNIIVDFLYDEIHNIGESHWPAPGPLRPEFFIGAFFRQGEDVGYLIINEDGHISDAIEGILTLTKND
mgnify:CR=1 FL=1